VTDDNLFERIFSEELPGKRDRAVGSPAEQTPEDWDAKPLVKTINGKDYELFTIGQLAKALGLKPVTLRSWEDKGWMPKPVLHTAPPRLGGIRNKALNGRRLWTREQVAGIVRIAGEEGMIGTVGKKRKAVDEARFAERVGILYRETMRKIKEQ
jgi:hypothetical protein